MTSKINAIALCLGMCLTGQTLLSSTRMMDNSVPSFAREAEPGDDRGGKNKPEPGNDRGRGRGKGKDDVTKMFAREAEAKGTEAQPGNDRGRSKTRGKGKEDKVNA